MSGSAQYPTTLVYTDADFRASFPAYADTAAYPAASLQTGFQIATNFISADNVGDLRDGSRQLAIYLMMVHMLQLNALTNGSISGAAPGLQTSAKIRDVTITWQAPPARSQWAWWLNQTGAGQTLQALLSVASAGGQYIGGSAGRLGFRQGIGREFSGGLRRF